METLVADVRGLPFPPGSFDLIVSNSTLDHFESPQEILRSLRELARVLRPGGNLVVTLDNPRNPVVRLRNALPGRWLRRLGVVPYPVGATCGASALRGMIRQAGLQTRRLTAIQHGPRALAVAAGALLDRWGRPGGRERFLRLLMAFESLECWPTRFWSGYFVAAAAVKPPPGPGEGRAP
jgi:SAM-dependent methyltransferase